MSPSLTVPNSKLSITLGPQRLGFPLSRPIDLIVARWYLAILPRGFVSLLGPWDGHSLKDNPRVRREKLLLSSVFPDGCAKALDVCPRSGWVRAMGVL